MAQKIVPNVWFQGYAEEGGAFYADALPRTASDVVSRYPDDVPRWQEDFAGKALTVDVVVDGYRITLINAGREFTPNPSISFILNFDPLLFDGEEGARRALDDTWAALSDGGEVLMALDAYPFSARYGWVQDRYGVSWQLMLTDPAGDPRPFVIPQLMYTGAVQGRAREAAEFYISLFDDAALGTVVPRPEGEAGEVLFGEFRIGDQWFSMMDSDIAHDFGFTPGVSLEVRCRDQAEIDRLWEALSAVPEAEQCGWLADRYGVSWQIVPENMGELMSRPGAWERLLEMKKLVIAEF
ncbi:MULTISPECIES: VOC family protein [Microbacterium]|uniref:VOC family protein n=1 Tax=Microbacterium TaxID=33882 RepID=UPI00217E9CF6|nr:MULTISPECIES: VOC family protein [Microbacterium]UWF77627.1 VOC family protein [Microbacterium neungamense]WCM55797.1 VOC family protein [Microbacterium sp. EF45047]